MITRYFDLFVRKIIKTKKSLLTKGSFTQDIAFVFSGRAIGMLSQIVFTPLLARVYGPEAYGVFSVFNALLLNLSTVATLRLENAVVLPESDLEFKKLLKCVFVILLSFSCVIFLISVFLSNQLITTFKFENEEYMIYLLGVFVFLTAFYNLTASWVVRQKEFKRAFKYETPVTVISRAFNLGYGSLTKGAVHGFLITDALLKVFSIFSRLRFILRQNLSFLRVSLTMKEIRQIINRYRQFPLYDMPATWLFIVSSQLPVYVIAVGFDTNAVGQIGFALVLLEVPLTLLANSIGPVFLQRASEMSRDSLGEVKRLVIGSQQKLLYVGVLPFTFIAAFGDKIFSLVFGSRWEDAGLYTCFLAVFYLFRLISSPLASVFVVYSKQHKTFIFHLILLLTRIIALTVGVFILNSVYWSILLYSIVSAVGYFCLTGMVLTFVGARVSFLLLRTILISAICLGIFLLLRTLIY